MARTDDELEAQDVTSDAEEQEVRRRSKTRHRRTERAADKRRPGTKADQEAQEKLTEEDRHKPSIPRDKRRSPNWWAPLMCTLMILGLIVIVVAYVSHVALPIPGLGQANLFIGFGLLIAGFLMTMGWR